MLIYKGQEVVSKEKMCKIAKSCKTKKLEALKIKTSRGVEHRGVEAALFRMLNRRDSTQWRSLVSHEAPADEISATGGHQRKPLSNASHCLRSGAIPLRRKFKTGTTVKVVPVLKWSIGESNP